MIPRRKPPRRRIIHRASIALYRILIAIRYGKRRRSRFGGEMVRAFGLLLEDEITARGCAGVVRAWVRVAADLVAVQRGGLPPPGRGAHRARRVGPWERGPQGRGGVWLRGTWQDLVFAWRSLARDVRFTGLVLGLLGLGIGLNVAVFSVVNAYLLRPLPYPHADRVVNVRPATDVSWTEVDHLFEKSVSWDLDVFTLVGSGRPEMVRGAWVTPDFLDLYGVSVALGRAFRPEEAEPGAAPVALISHRLWTSRFGSDPSIIGQAFSAFTSDRPDHSEAFRIVGVLARDFWHVHEYTEVLAPIRVERSVYAGRLRPDVPSHVAAAAMTDLARSTMSEVPSGFQVQLEPVKETYLRAVRPRLSVLQGAGLLVLLIACANSVVLLLVRAAGRQQEVCMRRALGGHTARIARQLGLEGLLLGVGAGLAGTALAVLLLEVARAGVGPSVGQAVPGGPAALRLDMAVVYVAGLASLAIGGALAIVPAVSLLAGGFARAVWVAPGRGGGETRGGRRLREAMVVVEVALSTALLAGAALMVRSAAHLNDQTLGFDADQLVRGSIGLRRMSYPIADQRLDFFESVLTRVREAPDVESAALASSTPFSGFIDPVLLEGQRHDGETAVLGLGAQVASVGDGYFGTMGVRVRRGRDFGRKERTEGAAVAIVSAGVAEGLWPGRDPIGARIRVLDSDGGIGTRRPGPWLSVVGVVDDVLRDLDTRSDGQLYLPYAQDPGFWMALVVRRRGSAASVVATVEEILAAHDPDVPFSSVSDVRDRVDLALAPTRFSAAILGGFSGFALALALVGLYGVVAYAARQSRRAVAVRLAVGAARRSIVGLFVRRGMTVVVLGVGFGGLAGVGFGKALAGQLRGVSPGDPAVHLAVAGALLLTAALAVWLPARDAARASPMRILRED